jgi:hypothetical protein
MTDIYSILRTSYATTSTPSRTPYKPVDPKLYQGSWNGKYSDGKSFSFTVSNVHGFRAKVKYQNGDGAVLYQDVLIKDNAFRIGDTKFLLKRAGHAQIKSVVTNAGTGAQVLNTAYADQS